MTPPFTIFFTNYYPNLTKSNLTKPNQIVTRIVDSRFYNWSRTVDNEEPVSGRQQDGDSQDGGDGDDPAGERGDDVHHATSQRRFEF